MYYQPIVIWAERRFGTIQKPGSFGCRGHSGFDKTSAGLGKYADQDRGSKSFFSNHLTHRNIGCETWNYNSSTTEIEQQWCRVLVHTKSYTRMRRRYTLWFESVLGCMPNIKVCL